jgi:hypothetical protein
LPDWVSALTSIWFRFDKRKNITVRCGIGMGVTPTTIPTEVNTLTTVLVTRDTPETVVARLVARVVVRARGMIRGLQNLGAMYLRAIEKEGKIFEEE